uniref:C-type lectin domain-containing protein n=1 Tax=Sphenodon punctatus TaxID=8508 RepID=A0A8D0GY99_SPHPU
MLLLNVSQGTAEVDLKLKKTQEDTKREFAALKDSGLEMAKNLDELQDQLLNVSGTLAKVMAGIEKGQAGHREELLDLQDSLAALRAMGNNWTRSVLQELGAARHGQETIGTDVKQLLKEMKNITEHFCTSCPTGWKSFEKSCYFWSSERKSWMEAERACAKDEAYLAIINNVAEQKFLMSYVNEPNVYWIGLSDRGNEGTWVWVDGSLMVLSFWGEGEPNNVGDGEGEDCASLRFNGKWNDALCSVRESQWKQQNETSRMNVSIAPCCSLRKSFFRWKKLP